MTPTLAYFRQAPYDPKRCELVVVCEGKEIYIEVPRHAIVLHLKTLLDFIK